MNIIEYYWTGIYVHNDDIYPYLLNVLAVIAVLNNYATKGLDIYSTYYIVHIKMHSLEKYR